MADLRFTPLPTEVVRALQAGAPDANGQPPEVHVSDGNAVPCRHCLREVATGERYLILAHRPFPAPQPYAEVGPIFLHAEPCARYTPEAEIPQMFRDWEHILMRGYGADDRIVYGTGQVVATGDLAARATAILERPGIAYVHLRSAKNNCYLARVERV